jgi:hypothetical protein
MKTEPREDAPVPTKEHLQIAKRWLTTCSDHRGEQIISLAELLAERERAVRLTEQQIRDALTSWHIDCGNWQLVGITKMLNADLSTSAQPAAGQETEET